MDLFRWLVEIFEDCCHDPSIRTKKKTKYRKSTGRELRGTRRGMVDVLSRSDCQRQLDWYVVDRDHVHQTTAAPTFHIQYRTL